MVRGPFAVPGGAISALRLVRDTGDVLHGHLVEVERLGGVVGVEHVLVDDDAVVRGGVEERIDAGEGGLHGRGSGRGRGGGGDGSRGDLGRRGVAGTLRCDGALLRPSLEEQDGQAPQPCDASTRSATTICCSRVALSAVAANWPPPWPVHVLGENCSPPW